MDIKVWQPITTLSLNQILVILGLSIAFDTVYAFFLRIIVVSVFRIKKFITGTVKNLRTEYLKEKNTRFNDEIKQLQLKFSEINDIVSETRLEVQISNLRKRLQKNERQLEAITEEPFTPFVSIIIPVHNGEDVIEDTLKSLLALEYENKEIIVVDDASKDNTYERAAKFEPQINLIKRERSTGLKTGAVNFGLSFSRGEIVAVIDDDTTLEPDSLTYIVQAFRDPGVSAATGNIRTKSPKKNMLVKLQSLEFLNSMEIGRPFQDIVFGVPFVISGALSIFRKEVMAQIGEFDIDIITEDLDITWKLYRLRRRIAYVHDAVAYTDTPNNFKTLKKQRYRWDIGFFQTLVKQRSLTLNWRYGRVGMLMLPETVTVEVIVLLARPFYFTFLVICGYPFFTAILILLLYYIVLQFLETLIAGLFSSKKKLALNAFYAPIMIAYRQYLAAIRLRAFYDFLRKKKATW